MRSQRPPQDDQARLVATRSAFPQIKIAPRDGDDRVDLRRIGLRTADKAADHTREYRLQSKGPDHTDHPRRDTSLVRAVRSRAIVRPTQARPFFFTKFDNRKYADHGPNVPTDEKRP